MGTINAGGFTLEYERNLETVIITGCRGADARLTIPKEVTEGEKQYPVVELAKKAFLGLKGLREVSIPDSVNRFGDWAFAQCIHLTTVNLDGNINEKNFGRAVFDGCLRLERINLTDSEDEALPGLLAAVVGRLPAEYLQRDSEIGEPNWYLKWDMSLTGYLRQDDHEGSVNAALCGEEDISYDGIGSVDGELLGADKSYILGVCKNKAYLCFLRLANDRYLSDENRALLEDYIRNHAKGKGNGASWQSLKDDFKDKLEFFKMYLDIIGPDAGNFDAMLQDLGDDCAEVRAFLIKESLKNVKQDSFFEDLLI